MLVLNSDAAYLAGVMDADGSFSITKRHIKRKNVNYTAMIQLTWTESKQSIEFIKELTKTYGGSYFLDAKRSTYKSVFKHSKPVVKYCVTGVGALRLATSVLPYLRLKVKQAENVIKLLAVVNDRNYQGKTRPKTTSDKLEALYLLNRALNSKNGGTRASIRI